MINNIEIFFDALLLDGDNKAFSQLLSDAFDTNIQVIDVNWGNYDIDSPILVTTSTGKVFEFSIEEEYEDYIVISEIA